MPRGNIVQETGGYELGFETGRTPLVTEQQFCWLAHRLGTDNDLDPCKIMQLDPLILQMWLDQPDFSLVYKRVLDNKREAFKYMATQLLPKALRVINDLLDESSVSARKVGLDYILRTNGLLIDKVKVVDQSAVQRLMESLNRPMQVIDGEMKALPEPGAPDGGE